jgi:hypothetical protein
VRHVSRSSSLLGVEASLARISQSGLKTGGGVTVGGACGTIVEVVSDSATFVLPFFSIMSYEHISHLAF